MGTTTLRIPDELKDRVAAAAEAAGVTPHGFMLRAIETQTVEAEEQAAFERAAAQRWRQLQRDGQYFAMEEVREYMMARARGETSSPPQPRTLSRDELAGLRARKR
jgi:predicted transcriptional regulator